MSLVEHARRELALLGEEPGVIDWYCRVVAEFASAGHSGGSASVAIPVLHELLQFHPLTPLTSDPAEWIDRSESSGYPIWQNRRHSEAFSEDGGQSYWLLSERDAAGSAEVTPLHVSEVVMPLAEAPIPAGFTIPGGDIGGHPAYFRDLREVDG